MPITDYQINRTARIYSDRHGEHAVVKARERAADLQRRGDLIGADMWLRVIVALEHLQKTGGTAGYVG